VDTSTDHSGLDYRVFTQSGPNPDILLKRTEQVTGGVPFRRHRCSRASQRQGSRHLSREAQGTRAAGKPLPAKRNPTRDDFTPLILIPNTDSNSKVFPKAWPDFVEIATKSTHGFIIKSNLSHG